MKVPEIDNELADAFRRFLVLNGIEKPAEIRIKIDYPDPDDDGRRWLWEMSAVINGYPLHYPAPPHKRYSTRKGIEESNE